MCSPGWSPSGTQLVIGQDPEPYGPAAHVVAPIGRTDDGARGVLGHLAAARDRRSNAGTRMFLDFVGVQIGSSLDEAAGRDRELGEHRTINETLQAAMITPIVDTGTVAARYVPAAGNLSVGGDWYDLVDARREPAGAGRRRLRRPRPGRGHGDGPAAQRRPGDARSKVADPASGARGARHLRRHRRRRLLRHGRVRRDRPRRRRDHLQPAPATRRRCSSGPDGHAVARRGAVGAPRRRPRAGPRERDGRRWGPTTCWCSTPTASSSGGASRSTRGLARLADAVARAADGSVAALADGLLRDLVGDGSGDDVVVMVKRLQG